MQNKQILVVEDEAAIRDCMARYARGIDRMDRGLILGAYWEDGYDRHAHFGGTPAEFTDWVLDLLAGFYADLSRRR